MNFQPTFSQPPPPPAALPLSPARGNELFRGDSQRCGASKRNADLAERALSVGGASKRQRGVPRLQEDANGW